MKCSHFLLTCRFLHLFPLAGSWFLDSKETTCKSDKIRWYWSFETISYRIEKKAIIKRNTKMIEHCHRRGGGFKRPSDIFSRLDWYFPFHMSGHCLILDKTITNVHSIKLLPKQILHLNTLIRITRSSNKLLDLIHFIFIFCPWIVSPLAALFISSILDKVQQIRWSAGLNVIPFYRLLWCTLKTLALMLWADVSCCLFWPSKDLWQFNRIDKSLARAHFHRIEWPYNTRIAAVLISFASILRPKCDSRLLNFDKHI